MPWLETSSVEQREQFIADHRRGLYTMTELCARYSISRKSGYKSSVSTRAAVPASATGAELRTSARIRSRLTWHRVDGVGPL